MKTLAGIFGFIAGIFGCIAVIYLVAWLYSFGMLALVGGLLLLAAAAAGLGALAVYCRRAQEQRDRIEEKLDALMNKKGDTDENT